MNALKRFIAMLLLALLSTTVFAITDNQLFAYAEATHPDIFTGTAAAGQFRQGGQEYNYRFYKASGNYLAVDPAGVISIMGTYTGNKVTRNK